MRIKSHTMHALPENVELLMPAKSFAVHVLLILIAQEENMHMTAEPSSTSLCTSRESIHYENMLYSVHVVHISTDMY